MEDSEFTAEDETESFQSGEEFQDHEDFQNGEESISEEIRYIKGRPLTGRGKEEQLAPIKELTPLDPGIQVDRSGICLFCIRRECWHLTRKPMMPDNWG